MASRFFQLFEDNAEHLRVITACPICNARYHSGELRILEEKTDAQLVHVQCRKCRASVLAVVLANHLGVSSVGLVTDLSGDDVLKFRRQPTISIDDVLDLHCRLQEVDAWHRM
jgi:hypothetical protein